MSVNTKSYSFDKFFVVEIKSGISSISPKYLKQVEEIMQKVDDMVYYEIEKELYKQGLMTCNACLESIDDMRINGNYLVQASIKELDEKYKEDS